MKSAGLVLCFSASGCLVKVIVRQYRAGRYGADCYGPGRLVSGHVAGHRLDLAHSQNSFEKSVGLRKSLFGSEQDSELELCDFDSGGVLGLCDVVVCPVDGLILSRDLVRMSCDSAGFGVEGQKDGEDGAVVCG